MARLDGHRRRLLARVVVVSVDFSRSAESGLARHVDPALLKNPALLVLTKLASDGAQRPMVLNEELGFTSGGLANLLGRLEALGVVRRVTASSSSDHRAVSVELTEAGARTEAVIVAGLVENLQHNAGMVRDLLLTLEHLGARWPTPPVGLSGAALIRSLAGVGVELTSVMDVPVVGRAGAYALVTIADAGPCRPRYVAGRLHMSPAGLAKVVDRLEANGFLRRDRSGQRTDKRAVLLGLAPAGVETVNDVLGQLGDRLDPLAQALSNVALIAGA